MITLVDCSGILSYDVIENAVVKYLSEEETRRFRAFENDRDKRTYLAGKIVSKQKLAELLGANSTNKITFKLNEYGRPFVDGYHLWNPYCWNISHCNDMMVFGIHSGAEMFGIDVVKVELPEPFLNGCDYVKEYRMCFTEQEWDHITKGSDVLRDFYTFWALKESVLKALSTGLRDNMAKYEFRINSKASISLHYNGIQDKRFYFELIYEEDYIIAVCSSKKGCFSREFTQLNSLIS
jgi:phosphopantetheine--protein transferase-like protein